MSDASSPQAATPQQPFRRLKLVMSTADDQPPPPKVMASTEPLIKQESSSPTRPSYSPVTPTLSHSSAVGQDGDEPEWVNEPDPLPVSLDENPDAIALRATLSLLQMQRQQSLKDIRGLSKIRQDALENPEQFVEDLKEGKLSQSTSNGIIFDQDSDESDGERNVTKKDDSKFGKLPTGQNIARCPPIEWSKYHINGEPLDRLHELQKQYPGVTEEALMHGLPLQQHEIAAPYRPFTDQLAPVPPSTESRNYDR